MVISNEISYFMYKKEEIRWNNITVRKTERISEELIIDELGSYSEDGNYILVSSLTSPIAVESQIDFVVLVKDDTEIDTYNWYFQVIDTSEVDSQLNFENGYISYTPKHTGNFRVVVELISGGNVITVLSIYHKIICRNIFVESLIEKEDVLDVQTEIVHLFDLEQNIDIDIDSWIWSTAFINNPEITREIVNDLQRYIQEASLKHDIPVEMIGSIVYKGILSKDKEDQESDIITYSDLLNGEDFTNDVLTELSLGKCQLKPLFAAMIKYPDLWDEIPEEKSEREDKIQEISDKFINNLSKQEKINLFNLLRFPKSNILLCAEFLSKLKNRTNPTRYNGYIEDVFLEDECGVKIIASEYYEGPHNISIDNFDTSKHGNRIYKLISIPLFSLCFLPKYLYDTQELKNGDYDEKGATRYNRAQNVPSTYIYDLQKNLKYLGFTEIGEADGAFGSKSERVIRSLQILADEKFHSDLNEEDKETDIRFFEGDSTGICGRSTKDQIIYWMTSGLRKPKLYGPYNLQQGDRDDLRRWEGVVRDHSGNFVLELQNDLIRLGYWVSSPSDNFGMNNDGIFGNMVHGSVWLFQREHELDTTGIAGVRVASRIKKILLKLEEEEKYERPGNMIIDAGPLGNREVFQLSPSRNFSHRNPDYHPTHLFLNDLWGKKESVECMNNVARIWVENDKEIFDIGDMIKNDGSAFPPEVHRGHRRGVEADIRSPIYCNLLSESFDKRQSLELAILFFENGVDRILFDCKYVIDQCEALEYYMRALWPHHHHFHVDVGFRRNVGERLDQYCLRCTQYVAPDEERNVLDAEWNRLFNEVMLVEEREEYLDADEFQRDEYVIEHSLRCFYHDRRANR